MPIRYIGKPVTHKGKYLFEILVNLKQYGKGRVVVRELEYLQHQGPSYYVITKVRPTLSLVQHDQANGLMDPLKKGGFAWGIHYVNGVCLGEQQLQKPYSPEWRLISKDREDEFRQCEDEAHSPVVLPGRGTLPPAFATLASEHLLKNGHDRDMFKMGEMKLPTESEHGLPRFVTDPQLVDTSNQTRVLSDEEMEALFSKENEFIQSLADRQVNISQKKKTGLNEFIDMV